MSSHTSRLRASEHTLPDSLIKALSLHEPVLREVRQSYPSADAPGGKLVGHIIYFDSLPKELYAELSQALGQRYGQTPAHQPDWMHAPARNEDEQGVKEEYRGRACAVEIRGELPVAEIGAALGLPVPGAGHQR